MPDEKRFDNPGNSPEGKSLRELFQNENQEVVITEHESKVSSLESLISAIDSKMAESQATTATSVFDRSGWGTAQESERYVVFTLSEAIFAFPIGDVTEIGEVPAITPLPNVPDWLSGVANIRGNIVSVVDLGVFIGTDSKGPGDSGKMIVAHTDRRVRAPHRALSADDGITVALIVDDIKRIMPISPGQIGMPAAPIEDEVASFLVGVCQHGEELIAVLDVERFIHTPEMQQFR